MADLTFDCPECSHNLVVDTQAAGLVVACPECGTQIRVPCPDSGSEAGESAVPEEGGAATPDAAPLSGPEVASETAVEYRVISMIAGEGGAEITADAVEFRLNELTQEGWRLRSATTVPTCDAQGLPNPELLLIMERNI